MLVGYFNRNTKQEFDIPAGPNNRIEPGPGRSGTADALHAGRQWGVFTIKLPKDFGTKKLTWTIVANGFTNTITLHTKPDYIVEPFEDAANKNTPPKLKFEPTVRSSPDRRAAIAEKYTGTVGVPLPLTVWITDEGAEDQRAGAANGPRPRPRRRSAGGAAAATGAPARPARRPARGAARGAAPEGSRRRRRWRSPGRSSAGRAT